MPIGTDFFYDENYIRRLPRVMKQIGVKSCFAIATEPLLPESNYFEFETTKKGLSAFHWECGLFRFALFPEDLSFFILWTVDDYFLIAGEREFVESAIGSSVETAFEKFKEWAIGWPTEVNGIRLGVREFLLGIYARYKAVNDEILKNNEEG
ncbi:MAG: hypothetical protein OEV44_01190 [Spirochaetota bacterium]|nr:hypothetical protein [Spirochaetota bacterium]